MVYKAQRSKYLNPGMRLGMRVESRLDMCLNMVWSKGTSIRGTSKMTSTIYELGRISL